MEQEALCPVKSLLGSSFFVFFGWENPIHSHAQCVPVNQNWYQRQHALWSETRIQGPSHWTFLLCFCSQSGNDWLVGPTHPTFQSWDATSHAVPHQQFNWVLQYQGKVKRAINDPFKEKDKVAGLQGRQASLVITSRWCHFPRDSLPKG